MKQVYSTEQLGMIVEQATFYMCACPAQVADSVRKLRQLYDYQMHCIARGSSDINEDVHNRIAQATVQAHEAMESCMQDILRIEGWDLETLEMPQGLRALRDREALE